MLNEICLLLWRYGVKILDFGLKPINNNVINWRGKDFFLIVTVTRNKFAATIRYKIFVFLSYL